MGTLFGALNSSLSALRAFQNALNVTQNNVSNASTPGYSAQIASFESVPFDQSKGLGGGVQSGDTQSTDNQYADQAVRNQYSLQGSFTAQSTALSSIESLFDTTGQSGIIGALNNLFQSFSAWSATPDSAANRQDVLTKASNLAQEFQSAASSLSQATNQTNQQISSVVQQINALGAKIAADNSAIALTHPPDAGIAANLEASLENLSKLANVTATVAPNGSVTVLLDGQTPLVVGSQQFKIQANFSNTGSGGNPNAVPNVQITDSTGQDITNQVSQGTLGGLLNIRNTVLPSLQGNSTQQGTLNTLAQKIADRVNQILTSAKTSGGQSGTALFTYSSASPVDVAATLALNPAITLNTLAPVNPGPPAVSNGAALQLSNLGNSTASGDVINGQTMLQFATSIATQVGQQSADAKNAQTLHTQLLSQAQAVQTQISGVSLDAEAIQVLQLQKGYEAASKMVSVINSLATTLINTIPN